MAAMDFQGYKVLIIKYRIKIITVKRYNGIGGFGGNIYFRAVEKLDFEGFCTENEGKGDKIVAESGENARQVKLVGKIGKDLFLNVPLGVEVIRRVDNMLLARCSSTKQKYLICRGGRGGCAANGYRGEKGDSCFVDVHLKLRPNVGLIGYPNAGKSTLLKALVPRDEIEIADYAFTTKRPQLSYMKYTDEVPGEFDDRIIQEINQNKGRLTPFTLSIADLPGIVEGASKNKYEGFCCLKHLEYSEIIIMVIDVHGFQLGSSDPMRSPLETIALLNREMEEYDKNLIRKPTILLINKVDIGDGQKKGQELCDIFIEEGPSGKWAYRLPTIMRPRFPILFKSFHAISAKEHQLGNLQEILRCTYKDLHPLRRPVFNIDIENDTKRKLLC